MTKLKLKLEIDDDAATTSEIVLFEWLQETTLASSFKDRVRRFILCIRTARERAALEVAAQPQPGRHWRTHSGRLVREVARRIDQGQVKILCSNTTTSGSVGWLRADRLHDPGPTNPPSDDAAGREARKPDRRATNGTDRRARKRRVSDKSPALVR